MRAEPTAWERAGKDRDDGLDLARTSATRVVSPKTRGTCEWPTGRTAARWRPGRTTKRVLDIVVAAIVLVLVLPVVLAGCLAILLETPGSPVFLQWRSGLHGIPFRIIKLRTMVAGAERLGPALTQTADPRITRVGAVLRRLSVDELPQLVNVLAGQMSLVGPRPELVQIVDGYSPEQRVVLSMRPGITGWAQVNGRDDLTIPAKLALERDYVTRWTLGRDLAILARTVRVVLSGGGTKS